MEDTDLLKQLIQYNKLRLFNFKNGVVMEEDKRLYNILNARYNKISRIKKRFYYLVVRYKYIWFITFTLNDDNLDKCYRTHKNAMRKVLDNYDFKYILNVDYGKKNERLHYHCILATNSDVDLDIFCKYNYTLGFTKSILCNTYTDDINRLCKYIDKLCNHALKTSTKNRRIIYNFKGYDLFSNDAHTNTLQYKLERHILESVPFNGALLDKGAISGK